MGEAELAPGLYLVATAIGNLGDVTLRALDVLRGVDRIFCEDTRVTARLLARYEIAKPLGVYHDHNAEPASPLLARQRSPPNHRRQPGGQSGLGTSVR
jgi:16S rRNA (cytidine1402-2'-O)-methyltransferase